MTAPLEEHLLLRHLTPRSFHRHVHALAKNLVVSYSLIGPDVDTKSLGMGDVELKTVPLPKNEITRYGLSEGANANR